MRLGVVALVVALAVCAQFPSTAFARPLDGADVAGVRIGMTLDEARAVLAKRFPSGEFQSKPVWCVADYLIVIRSRFTAKPPRHCVANVTMYDDLIAVELATVEDYPAHPGAERVFGVRYEQDGLLAWNGDDERAFLAAVVRKYGKPDMKIMDIPMWGEVQSIGNPPELPQVAEDGTVAGSGTATPSAPFLVVDTGPLSGIVELFDYAFSAPRDAAIRAAYDAIKLPPTPVKF